MALEIERKFLVTGSGWRDTSRNLFIRQGYLSTDPERTVRIRIADRRGFLTIKSRATGIVRHEFEYEIPVSDADAILECAVKPIIEKRRWLIDFKGLTWEVDEFHGENQGLVIAEVELNSPTQKISRPSWTGGEVTHDPRYLNVNLTANPYSKW